MALRTGKQPQSPWEDINKKFLALEGELDDQEARATFGEFLYHNIKLTTQLLTGIRLAPYQVLMIKAWFMRNFSLNVWGRGCAKSTLAGIFSVLYCIFNPEASVLIVSSNFRSSRRILEAIEKLAKHPKGRLLKQIFEGDLSRRNDVFSWKMLNHSAITCVPLSNGDGLRGLRAHVLIVDEALLVSKEIITTILMPFLVASANITDRLAKREEEDRKIAAGTMKEEDREVFESTSKMILLSSASFKFEYLYEIYEDYLRKIAGKPKEKDKDDKTEEVKMYGTYFVSQLSFEVVPPDLLDKAILQEATGGTTSEQTILREYKAQFVDGSEGYFSPKKMELCTIPDRLEPTTETKGEAGFEYVLAIDPSNSSSESGDHFAMSVIKILPQDDGSYKGLLVHSYAEAGADFKDNVSYLMYILDAFEIVYIISDTTQGDSFDFISAANESVIFNDRKIELKALDADFGKEDQTKVLEQIKKSYNRQGWRIVQKQSFNSSFLRAANEYLQVCIDYQKVLFASRASALQGKAGSMNTPILARLLSTHKAFKECNSIHDFVDWQDDLIKLTKKECALVEVKQSATGQQSFDLPQSMKRSESPSRPRKDNYSTLMMGMWAVKLYTESKNLKVERWGNDVLPELF